MNEKRKYDSTVARIAGNLLSGVDLKRPDVYELEMTAKNAVFLARFIVAETKRTEPADPAPEA